MTSVDVGPGAPNLVERAKNIILTPKAEWDRIETEPATIRGLFTGYACILAAIGPVAGFIGMQVFGLQAFIAVIRPTLASSAVTAVASYITALVGVYVCALIIEALTPSFGGVKDRTQAFKVAVYSFTAAWLAGIFQIVPALGWLGLLGLYSFYLLYLGLPKLMKVPEDKAAVFTAVVAIVGLVVFVVAGAVTGAIVSAFGGLFGAPATTIRM